MADIERWPEWTPTVTRIQRLDSGPLAVGSRARIRQPKLPPATWQVSDLQPGRSFTWITRSPGVCVAGEHGVEPTARGSRVMLSLRFSGVLGPLVARLTRGLNQRYLALEAQGLTERSTSFLAAGPRPRTGRPLPGEYADYASADIAAVTGDDAIEALAQLAQQTPAFFRALADAAGRGLTYGPGKWTLKEILGHVVDDERIFAYRLLCVARGESGELPGFDENRYAAHGQFERRTMEDLLAEYAAVRTATLALLGGLPAAAWARHGVVNGYGCSVRGLAFHIAGHELHHLRIVRERYVPLSP